MTQPKQDAPAVGSLTGTKLAALRSERLIFRDLDFHLAPGGVVVLKGPNGSGKSTLLRMVAGFLEPAEGTLVWSDRPAEDEEESRLTRICYLGHLDAVKPVFTVRENVAFWARLSGLTDEQRIDAALSRFALDGLSDQPARFLSAGQKRRAALARLGVTDAPLWLLDEPTVSLDKASVAALGSLIAEHCGRGGMAMIATHIDLGLAQYRELDLSVFAGKVAA